MTDEPGGLLVEAGRRPVSATACAVSVWASLAAWSPLGYEHFVMDERAFAGEPWRLITATFVHVNVIHLAFNVWWIWVFGGLLEPRLGSVRFASLVLWLALAVELACHAFDVGGVGLSGVGYGLWAFLLVGGRRGGELRGLIDGRTHGTWIAWFFFCILVTQTGLLRVSNWGHGAGAALGALLGCTADTRMLPVRLTKPGLAAQIAVTAALFVCAARWREQVNFGAMAEADSYAGYQALEEQDWERARFLLERSTRVDPRQSRTWWNLAVARAGQGDESASLDAALRAHAAGQLDAEQRRWLARALQYRAREQFRSDEKLRALDTAKQASAVDPDDEEAWKLVGWMAIELGVEECEKKAADERRRLQSRAPAAGGGN